MVCPGIWRWGPNLVAMPAVFSAAVQECLPEALAGCRDLVDQADDRLGWSACRATFSI